VPQCLIYRWLKSDYQRTTVADHLPTYSLLELNAVCEPFLSIHKALTKEVISWICDSKRRNNVYIIAEPRIPRLVAHEHSRAAVFANICSDAQRFGRFFNNHVPRFPYDIYPLSGELAAAYPPYRRSLARVLTDSPGIHELPLRTRFKKLISEPWKELEESHPQYSNTPPVIVLRWDSEWENDELLRSICEFGSHSSPLLWIISIDTSSKLPILDLLDPLAPFHYFRLPIRYTEAQVDTALVLYYKLDVLRLKHKEIFHDNEVWPSVGQMSRLIRIVAGVFEFVDVIIQFIDWTDNGGPRAHLETFLTHMADSPSPSDEHPYSALDHFYINALTSIPSDLHPVMKKAFGIICYLKYCNSAELACLLSLGNNACLPHFKRFADIGTDGWLHKSSCTCLRRFIESSNRSGQFHMPESESRLAVFQACLHILSHSSDATILLKPKAVQWIEADQNAYCIQTKRLWPTACSTLCDIRGAGEEWTSLLRRFDFRCLAHNCDYIFLHTFMEFLRHLSGVSLRIK
jgi:hypothetical protein